MFQPREGKVKEALTECKNMSRRASLCGFLDWKSALSEFSSSASAPNVLTVADFQQYKCRLGFFLGPDSVSIEPRLTGRRSRPRAPAAAPRHVNETRHTSYVVSPFAFPDEVRPLNASRCARTVPRAIPHPENKLEVVHAEMEVDRCSFSARPRMAHSRASRLTPRMGHALRPSEETLIPCRTIQAHRNFNFGQEV